MKKYVLRWNEHCPDGTKKRLKIVSGADMYEALDNAKKSIQENCENKCTGWLIFRNEIY